MFDESFRNRGPIRQLRGTFRDVGHSAPNACKAYERACRSRRDPPHRSRQERLLGSAEDDLNSNLIISWRLNN